MTLFAENHWPNELVILFSEYFLGSNFISKRKEEILTPEGHIKISSDRAEKDVLTKCGVSQNDLIAYEREVDSRELEMKFESVYSFLQFALKYSKPSVLIELIKLLYAENELNEDINLLLKRYGLIPPFYDYHRPLQLVYGSDLISDKFYEAIDLFPILLVCDHILLASFVNSVPEMKMLADENILCCHHISTFYDSVLFYEKTGQYDSTENECYKYSELSLSRQSKDYDGLDVLMNQVQGYSNAIKLDLPVLILPGDFIPSTFASTHHSKINVNESISQLFGVEMINTILSNLTSKHLPVEEILEIRKKLRSSEAFLEFREYTLNQISSLFNDASQYNYSELMRIIKLKIGTEVEPAVKRLQREMLNINATRNNKFLTKIKQEGSGLTLNLGRLLFGPNRISAITTISDTIYKAAIKSKEENKVDIPFGYSYLFEVKKHMC